MSYSLACKLKARFKYGKVHYLFGPVGKCTVGPVYFYLRTEWLHSAERGGLTGT
jgi:hypothetical protein